VPPVKGNPGCGSASGANASEHATWRERATHRECRTGEDPIMHRLQANTGRAATTLEQVNQTLQNIDRKSGSGPVRAGDG
jgi:hypothetical protein